MNFKVFLGGEGPKKNVNIICTIRVYIMYTTKGKKHIKVVTFSNPSLIPVFFGKINWVKLVGMRKIVPIVDLHKYGIESC